jgi:hypothetical protein
MGGITAEKARSELESLYPHLLEPWGWLFANDEEMGTPLQA